MNNNIHKRISILIDYLGISDRQFAAKIGVNQSVIGSMFQKETEPSAKVLKLILAAYKNLSAEWLMRGTGNMLLSENNSFNQNVTTIMPQENINDNEISTKYNRDKLINRIRLIIEYYKISSRAFSISIGFNYTTLNNYLTGRRTTIDSELIEKILNTYTDISAEWLIRGNGNMIIQPSTNEYCFNKIIDIINNSIDNNRRTIRLLENEINKSR